MTVVLRMNMLLQKLVEMYEAMNGNNSKCPSPALQLSLVLAAQPTMAQWSPSRRSSGLFMSTEEDSDFFKQFCNLYPYLTYCH
jgi:hypothetical protein